MNKTKLKELGIVRYGVMTYKWTCDGCGEKSIINARTAKLIYKTRKTVHVLCAECRSKYHEQYIKNTGC
jgi:hypothetical protein